MASLSAAARFPPRGRWCFVRHGNAWKASELTPRAGESLLFLQFRTTLNLEIPLSISEKRINDDVVT